MRKKVLIVALAVVTAFAFSGCGAQYEMNQVNALRGILSNVVISRDPQNNFSNLRGVETHVITTQIEGQNTSKLYHLSDKSFFIAPTIQYIHDMGFREQRPGMDYKLYVTIEEADYTKPYIVDIDLSVRLEDSKGTELFSQNGITASKTGNGFIMAANPKRKGGTLYMQNLVLDEAYTLALEQINWNRIASFLRTEQLPKDEPQKPVQGLGDTALEQTIIRWDVQSRPQGADISWRVVSKTPEVKSTNEKYLQTTPYEATKSLDIRGLTYQTAGDVRIILRCVKDGYMPQEKEYNVRMVLDQEEISAFFRLVKEE